MSSDPPVPPSSRPPPGPIAPPRRTPGMVTRMVPAPGGAGHVLTLNGKGDGIPFVLIHGFAGDAASWYLLAGGLTAHAPAHAVDLPGHGRTKAEIDPRGLSAKVDWLAAVLDGLGLDRVHLVGHSMGGLLALWLAARLPDRVDRASLLACAGLSGRFDLATPRAITEIETAEHADAITPRLFGASPRGRQSVAKSLAALGDRDARRRAMAGLVETDFAPAWRDDHQDPGAAFDWSTTHCPIQLIWGEDDRVIPPPPPSALPSTDGGGAPISLLPKVGHLPHIEAPTKVERLILAHARGLDPAEGSA